MKTFALTLLDSGETACFDAVTQFIAADADGSFGLLAGHAPTVAVLRYGLARFVDAAGSWHYLALPGGVLRFADNQLTVMTVRYFLGDNRDELCGRLEAAMQETDSELSRAGAALTEIEHSLVRRLADLSAHGREGLVP